MRRLRIDWEAVFWCAVAFVIYTIGSFPVLVLWRFVGGSSEGLGYTVVLGVWSALCAGAAALFLVREHPARGVLRVAGAMYAVIAGIALAIAAARLIATPALWQSPVMALLYGASGGLLDIESFRPLSVVPPKDWFVVGSLAGYALGRLVTGARPEETESDGTWWLSGMAKH